MAKVTVALKPKYTTRRAIDKVIFNDGNFAICGNPLGQYTQQ